MSKGLRFDVSGVRSGFWNLSVIGMGMRCKAVTMFKKGNEKRKEGRGKKRGGKKEERKEGKRKEKEKCPRQIFNRNNR